MQQEGKLSSKDISPVLKGWDYEPGTISVRKISGVDGLDKLQMRVDLGLLQMEVHGRPDGQRPHGCESLLEYYENLLSEDRKANGTELGFHLTPTQCQSLRDEAYMYYQRYVSLFVLEEFAGVVRDTARNLRVLDICHRYAVEENDRMVLEQYRPYLTMMNARAAASVLTAAGNYVDALKTVRDAMRKIKRFLTRYGQADAYAKTDAVKVLKRLARELRAKLPVDPLEQLQSQLQKAIRAEHYEEAAKLRDEINRITTTAESSE